ncbi:MAG: pilus assembly protein PilM [Actinomycetota bacterium]|nr:pilus assembly protein PilM [Actinomycetota bacterium]
MLAIGLNLSSYRIYIAELLKSRENLIIRKMVKVEVPPDSIVNGEIYNPEVLAGNLKGIWKKYKIPDRKVFIGIANQKVIAKEIKIPVVNDEEISNSIQYQINDFIPIPRNNIIYDYYVIEKGENYSRIMLVGAMKSMINDVASSFKRAGLLAQAIDLNCFALYRTMNHIYNFEKNEESSQHVTFCVVNIGLEISIIEMIQDNNFKYPRFTSTSIRSFINEIYKEIKKDNEYCEQVISEFDCKFLIIKKNKSAKKEETKNSPDKSGGKMDKKTDKSNTGANIEKNKIAGVIKRIADLFIEEIKISIEHFLQENPKSKVGKIILTGEYIKNIDKYIEQEIEYKVELLNISDYFSLKHLKGNTGSSESLKYILDPLAIGMALRGLNQ